MPRLNPTLTMGTAAYSKQLMQGSAGTQDWWFAEGRLFQQILAPAIGQLQPPDTPTERKRDETHATGVF
jgi:hypothetical protein